MGRQAHRRIGRSFQVGDALVDGALAQGHGAQDAGDQHVPVAQAALEVGDDGVLHEVHHLAGHAGQGDDGAPLVLDDKGRRRAHGVLHGDAALGQVGLAPIVVAHARAKAGEKGLDLGQQLGVEGEGPAGGAGHRLAGDVVHGGAQPAGGDDQVGAEQGLLQRLGDAHLVVAHRGAEIEVDAQVPQLAGQVGGVGVVDLPQEQLGPRRYDLGAHGTLPAGE